MVSGPNLNQSSNGEAAGNGGTDERRRVALVPAVDTSSATEQDQQQRRHELGQELAPDGTVLAHFREVEHAAHHAHGADPRSCR